MSGSGAGIRILVTDGGPHPADKWALHLAEQVVPLSDVKIGNRPAQALKLQVAVLEAVERHVAAAMAEEQAALKADPAHFDTPHAVDVYAAPVVSAVVACAQGTPWEAHFADPTVVGVITDLVRGHLNSVINIERSWHADRNPAIPEGQAYKTRMSPR